MKNFATLGVDKADKVFFEMTEKGWTKKKYNKNEVRHCISFVYEFLCLMDANNKCPLEKEWPENFVSIDKAYSEKHGIRSVFHNEHKLFVPNFENHTLPDLKDHEVPETVCHLKYHEVLLTVGKGDYTKEGLSEQLPPIFEYDTGIFVGYRKSYGFSGQNFDYKFNLASEVEVQEYAVKDNNDVSGTQNAQRTLSFAAVFKLYVCNVNGVWRAYVNNLKALNKKVHPFV